MSTYENINDTMTWATRLMRAIHNVKLSLRDESDVDEKLARVHIEVLTKLYCRILRKGCMMSPSGGLMTQAATIVKALALPYDPLTGEPSLA